MFLLPPAITVPLFLALGFAVGSFGNVVAGRLPAGESIRGRSHCPHCKRTLGALELVPVLSWLGLRGRCYGCKKRISLQYPMVEIATAWLFLLAILATGYEPISALFLGIALWAMLIITIIDTRTQLIPDALTLTLGICAIAVHALRGDFPVAAPLIGLIFFGAQWLLSRGKWVGSGDIFLSVALGFLLGTWEMMTVSLFIAYISGAIVVTFMLLTGSVKQGAHVAFGPFLIGGAFVTLLFGEKIAQVFIP